MTTLQINSALKHIEEVINVTEHNRDIARARGLNNKADELTLRINELHSEWERIFADWVQTR